MLALLKRYRELILVAVLLFVPLGVFFAHAKKPSELSRLDRIVLTVTSPIEKTVGWAVTGTLRGWNGYVALRHAQERATALSRQVNQLEMEKQQLLTERAENERLRKLLAFADASPDRTYVGGRIIGVRLGPAGRQLVTIDRGSKDGLARMMPVVIADGVVGHVHSVTASTADVLLLIDTYSSIAVRVDRTRARANVRGTGRPDGCKLDYALRTEDMIEGDQLVTSGTDGVFPRGLPVGKLTQVKRNAHGLFQEALVIPAVDVTRLEEVLVVTSPVPQVEDEPEPILPPAPSAGAGAAPPPGATTAAKPAASATGSTAPGKATATSTAKSPAIGTAKPATTTTARSIPSTPPSSSKPAAGPTSTAKPSAPSTTTAPVAPTTKATSTSRPAPAPATPAPAASPGTAPSKSPATVPAPRGATGSGAPAPAHGPAGATP